MVEHMTVKVTLHLLPACGFPECVRVHVRSANSPEYVHT